MICSRASTQSFIGVLEPVLYLYYEVNSDLPEGGFIEFPLDLDCSPEDAFDILSVSLSGGGIVVCKHLEGTGLRCIFQERPEKVEWAMPKTTFSSRQGQYAADNTGKLSVKTVYGDLCLVVRIGRTVAPPKKEWKIVDDEIQIGLNVRDEISSRERCMYAPLSATNAMKQKLT